MLKNPLFKIASLTHSDGQIDAELEINQQSEIFAGHFPDHPVVPGACMLQTVKEILAHTVKADISLVRADNIKFLSLVEPSASSLQLNISYQQTDNGLKVNASLIAGQTACMKLQGVFALR